MAKRARASKGGKSEGDYNPFLKAEHINDGDVVMLNGWTHRRDGQYGPQIIMEVIHLKSSKTYDLAVKEGSLSHKALHKGLGPDPAKWNGQITLGLKGGTTGDYIVIKGVESSKAPF